MFEIIDEKYFIFFLIIQKKSYLLPIKIDIRKKLHLAEDTIMTVSIDIIDENLII